MAWASTWGARPSWWLVDAQLQREGRWLLSWFEVYCSWELSACGSPVIHRGKSKRQMVTTLATPADFRIALDLWHGRGGRGAWGPGCHQLPCVFCTFIDPRVERNNLALKRRWEREKRKVTFWIIQGPNCDLRYGAGRESGWILVIEMPSVLSKAQNFQIKQQGMTDTFTLWFHLDWMVTFRDMNSGVNAVWKWLTY